MRAGSRGLEPANKLFLGMDLSWLSTWYLPAGFLIGFAAAAPIGSVNILVIQRTLTRGYWSAMALGLGGAVGDAVFAAIAALGLSALTRTIDAHSDPVRLAGGLILLGFALMLWRTSPHLNDPVKRMPRGRHMALATFVLTITNPATIIWFAGAFGAIGFQNIGHGSGEAWRHSGELILGVFLGSMAWWVFVAGLTSRLRSRLNDRVLTIINHVSAIVLALFGLVAIVAGLLPN
jgi:threonine/homoserine/homoserine lactone efflux protein